MFHCSPRHTSDQHVDLRASGTARDAKDIDLPQLLKLKPQQPTFQTQNPSNPSPQTRRHPPQPRGPHQRGERIQIDRRTREKEKEDKAERRRSTSGLWTGSKHSDGKGLQRATHTGRKVVLPNIPRE
ncbi:hypothetical protein GWK47_039877 [Chionoecetes opilio]|uniref:Uncharacterized protein n=1 Tax=Chionoecetes opilio TaxID=41210 RepID=A0A8J4YCR1_CHIOP|nr:hypothetical protein GWK47_039877 [Chionoecetes opilio]